MYLVNILKHTIKIVQFNQDDEVVCVCVCVCVCV